MTGTKWDPAIRNTPYMHAYVCMICGNAYQFQESNLSLTFLLSCFLIPCPLLLARRLSAVLSEEFGILKKPLFVWKSINGHCDAPSGWKMCFGDSIPSRSVPLTTTNSQFLRMANFCAIFSPIWWHLDFNHDKTHSIHSLMDTLLRYVMVPRGDAIRSSNWFSTRKAREKDLSV